MNIDLLTIRKSTIKDTGEIFKLYKAVSRVNKKINRDEEEISKGFVEGFTLRALKTGTQLVIVDPGKEFKIVGELHCYKTDPKLYNHVLSDLSIMIAPEYQGKGLGKRILETFLSNLTSGRRDILRVELIIRESNKEAIKLYEQLGFQKEGKMEKRIRTSANQLEADIPMAWFNPKFKRV